MDKRKKTVTIYSKDGKAVKTFESVNEAAVYLGTDKYTVSKSMHGVMKTCRGLIVREGNDKTISKFKPSGTDKRAVVQFDRNGNILNEWDSIHDAARSVSADPANIMKCLRGKKPTCAGYCWKYKE